MNESSFSPMQLDMHISVQKELPTIRPLSLIDRVMPFDDRDWIFEIKYDGFRALAYVTEGECRLLSRNLKTLNDFSLVSSAILSELLARNAVLDGEIVSMDENGVINFADLLNHKGRLCYFAFDLLVLNGRDQRDVPLLERKRRLKELVPPGSSCLHYADYVAGKGTALYDMAIKNDLEGIVAKPRDSRYGSGTVWYKIDAPHYSQVNGRKNSFESFRQI
jgi:bifunctional non-homologous end joining protein LigD